MLEKESAIAAMSVMQRKSVRDPAPSGLGNIRTSIRPFFEKKTSLSLIIAGIRRSISKKITLILVASVICAAVAGSLALVYSEYNDLLASLKEYSAYTIARLSTSLALPLWNVDTEQIDKIITSELKNENIAAILYKDAHDKDYSGRVKLESGAIADYSLTDDMALDKSFLVLKKNIVAGEQEVIGTVKLHVTDAGMWSRLRKRMALIVLQTVIIIGVIVFILSRLFDRYFIHKIIAINDGIGEIEKGNYLVNLKVDGTDELSNIALNIQAMSETIYARQRDLVKLQSFLSNIIESMPSILISLNKAGEVIQWNAAAERMFKITSNEIMGKKLWDLFPYFSRYIEAFDATIETNMPKMFSREIYGGDDPRCYNVSLFPLVENGDRGVVFRMDDITEIQKKDEQLRQAQKMELVGTLSGGLAHDFNNVLGGIMGVTSLMQHHLKRDGHIGSEELASFLDMIDEATRRAADIVQQLLVISRKQEINFAPVDLNGSLRHVIKICTNTFDKCVEIVPVFHDKPAMIHADQGQIEQVLLNILVNGYHSMTIMKTGEEAPGGKLFISIDRIESDRHFCGSHPEAEEGRDYWITTIRDTGVGMDPKIISKIFDPFYTTKTKDKGTGLGLAMVYNITVQHGGFVDVYSEKGHGTTFNMYLPVLKDSMAQEKTAVTEDVRKGSGLILVIDDERIIRETARAILEECGYSVVLANDGEEGLALYQARKNEIKAVVLDLIMPKMSGKEVYRKLKDIDPGVRVLLVSGFRQDERVDDLLRKGVDDFVQKPYTLKKLSNSIYKVVNRQ